MTVNQQTLKGNWNEIKGKLRDRWGQLSGDELESVHGNVEKLVGAIQKKTGEARESVEEYLEELTGNGASMVSQAAETVREYAQQAQQAVQGATMQAAEAVKAGYTKTEHAVEETVKSRPVESLAVCFGVGLITGVVVGLMMHSR